jgi:hypothetical protein
LNGSSVTFSTPGTLDFSAKNVTIVDRFISAIYGMLLLIMPMQVLGELENALDSCSSCLTAHCKSINSLYNAVAYYSGSIEKTSLFQVDSPLQDIFAISPSYSLYVLPESICRNFGTCEASGASNVNFDIFSAFSAMKIGLIKNCSEARTQKEIVSKKIIISMIQIMLYALNLMEVSSTRSTNELPNGITILGFVAATSILPLVHVCNSTSANTILQNFVGQGVSPSVAIVTAAMEQNYECLGITNAEVGVFRNNN